MKSVLVAVTGWNAEHWARCLRAALPDRTIHVTDRECNFDATAQDKADIAYALVWRPKSELLHSLPNLEMLFSLGAGVDHIVDDPNCPDLPIVRVVDPDLTYRMGEYVVWQVLHHMRRSADYARQQGEREWKALEQPAAREVTVGIMGMGVLGQHAAGLLTAIGFPVHGWSRTQKTVDGVTMFHGREGLDAFLGGSDILVALLPLTDETRGILNEELIAKLKTSGPLGGPVLINAGRGGSQVGSDIAQALHDGRLKGASLDVFSTEPLPEDDPLWTAPNCVITPHVAAVSSPEALAKGLAQQIASLERGDGVQNLIDRKRGY